MAEVARFYSLGASLADLNAAWQDRLADANSLLNSGRHAAAIAAGLYALEILLKTRICTILNLEQLPRVFEIHDLQGLATCAGLRQTIDDPEFKQTATGLNWLSVWDVSKKLEALRYSPDSRWTQESAETFLVRLNDENEGLIRWIQRQS